MDMGDRYRKSAFIQHRLELGGPSLLLELQASSPPPPLPLTRAVHLFHTVANKTYRHVNISVIRVLWIVFSN